MKETLQQANYKHLHYLGKGKHLFLNQSPTASYPFEVWVTNPSYGALYRKTRLIFVRNAFSNELENVSASILL